ncbi:hypothetical protein [Sulfitobacter sp. SK011]|uniref:hypothetical protein n=1 Tax=Sulfitobacter sp. SK011 TaxID=1389004 RepID=UPI0013B3C55A|nr:hypothetical protein [Sulfitobacter sp. SK011]
MSETIHSGNGTQRGVIIAIVVLVIFIAGIAMLGNGSAPTENAAPTAPAETGAADTNG